MVPTSTSGFIAEKPTKREVSRYFIPRLSEFVISNDSALIIKNWLILRLSCKHILLTYS